MRVSHYDLGKKLAMLTVNIIGAGNVGKVLGHLLQRLDNVEIASVFNRTLSNANASCQFIKAGTPINKLNQLQAADINFVATCDNAIAEVANALRSQVQLQPHSIIAHFSGVIPSDVFSNFREQTLTIASIHPLKGFCDDLEQVVNTFAGTFCATEGDAEALAVIKPLFEDLGAITFPIDSAKKALYHAGCIFSCNYLTTLFDATQQCYLAAGLDNKTAQAISLSLLQSTLDNLKQQPQANAAMSGPIKRADTQVLTAHLSQLADLPLLQTLYRELANATIAISNHDTFTKQQLMELLHEFDKKLI